jgi:hypothetical protein
MKHLAVIISIFLSTVVTYAGPPFNTDDPEPVDYKHWEYYISSINNWQNQVWSGTLPHFEINYGVMPNMQLHILLPINYSYNQFDDMKVGYANTELGLKYRFVNETKHLPQIGVFPIVEVPTINNRNFGDGKMQIFLPLWLQKSWGNFTTYGGGGYWINPGIGNKNWLFTGWEAQYDFTAFVLGGEFYYHTAPDVESKSSVGINIGGFINVTSRFHLLFSFGHSLSKVHYTTSYVGLLWTI